SPLWLDFTLDRSMEMLVGVGVPFLLLFLYEIYAFSIQKSMSPIKEILDHSGDQAGLIQVQNLFGIKVLGLAFAAIGLVFLTLALWAQQAGSYLAIAGILVMVLGGYLYAFSKGNLHEKPASVLKKNDKQQLLK